MLPEYALRQLFTLQKHWFSAMRAVRDSLVHSGARTLVFGKPQEGILFQVYGKHFSQVSEPALMWNKNVAHFDRYAAMVFAHLLCFLDDFGALVKKAVSAADVQPGFWARSYHSGFVVIQEWMLELLAQVRAPTE